MENFIVCNNQNLTAEQIMAALLTKDADGKIGIRVGFIDACETDANNCTTKMTTEQGFKASLGISECGKVALRLALPKGSFLNNVETYADDAAAASGGIPVGGIYYKTSVGLHTRMA